MAPFVPASWTREDYWGMAAFFTQVQTPGRSKQVYQLGVQDNRQPTLAALTNGGAPDGFLDRPPTFLGGETLQTSNATHRAALAAWNRELTTKMARWSCPARSDSHP